MYCQYTWLSAGLESALVADCWSSCNSLLPTASSNCSIDNHKHAGLETRQDGKKPHGAYRQFQYYLVLHSYITGVHEHGLSFDDKPISASCGLSLTVKHILVDCPTCRTWLSDLPDTRLKYFTILSLKDLLEYVRQLQHHWFYQRNWFFTINCSICYLYSIVAK